MPNSRRRKFSVQNDGSRRNTSKGGVSGAPGSSLNSSCITSSKLDSGNNETKLEACAIKQRNNFPNRFINDGILSHSSSNSSLKTNRNVTKPFPITSRAIDSMSVVLECDEYSSNSLEKKAEQDTEPTDLHTASTATNIPASLDASPQTAPVTSHLKRDTVRDKPRPHRVRVRSPKRNLNVLEANNEIHKEEDIATNVAVGIEIPCTETVGTNAIDWTQETLAFTVPHELDLDTEYEPSEHSLDDMCRICHSGDGSSYELGRLVSACACRGTVGRVHVRCLERWLTESGKSRCELCGTRYSTRRVHRYGVPKALVMWFLSQNAQQLMVDGLGIMLMSPLAVLAAWLSGRTLAGLMTQETQVTPWPLASTFVLACMTLVCYYCWIVSAATRHALGWWIWYRSQYEVRLQLQEED